MTARGPAVLLSSLDPSVPKAEGAEVEGEEERLDGPGAAEEPRSVVAQMLYARWIMSLRESREYSSPWLGDQLRAVAAGQGPSGGR